jgi:hypothetical protein
MEELIHTHRTFGTKLIRVKVNLAPAPKWHPRRPLPAEFTYFAKSPHDGADENVLKKKFVRLTA